MGREMCGRRRIPTKLHILHGNPSKINLKKTVAEEPSPNVQLKVPNPPIVLKKNKIARREWNRIAPELHRLGLLTDIDLTALALYCITYSQWIEAIDNIRRCKEGNKEEGSGMVITSPTGYTTQSPYMKIATEKASEIRSYLVEFGMTPSSRGRVKAVTKPPSEGDEFDDFMKKNGSKNG